MVSLDIRPPFMLHARLHLASDLAADLRCRWPVRSAPPGLENKLELTSPFSPLAPTHRAEPSTHLLQLGLAARRACWDLLKQFPQTCRRLHASIYARGKHWGKFQSIRHSCVRAQAKINAAWHASRSAVPNQSRQDTHRWLCPRRPPVVNRARLSTP